jgi:hypothetical protein
MDSPKQKKLWVFLDHPFFWGGIGVIVGAVGTTFSLGVLLVIAWVSISVAIVRTKFFERLEAAELSLIGNFILIAVVGGALLLIWKVAPAPKVLPSAEEIAVAVSRMQESSHSSIATTTDPPQQERLTVIHKRQPSTREDAPYKTELTIQSMIDFPSLKLVVECDERLVDVDGHVSGWPGGLYGPGPSGILTDHPNVFIFSYTVSMPPFGRQHPIVLDLWSKKPIKCRAAAY